LKEIQNAKDKMEEVKARQKDKRREELMKRRKGLSMDVEEPISASAAKNLSIINNISATNEATYDVDEDKNEEMDVFQKGLGQNSRRAYLRELRKVVDRADVILHVLDARDPIGTKSKSVEDMVLANGKKKLVLVLNKADLVPREALMGWLTFLRQSFATIPFKCNTQSQKGNLSIGSGKVTKQQEGALKSNHAIGAEELLGLLKNYARVGDTKSIITVGIVGFPNVGKSSLINSLTRTRAVAVSAIPGFTKVTQEVILDKNIRLIDSPGIVFADGDSAATVLRNCINVEEMEDVLTPVQSILDRCPQEYLMQLYSIPRFKDKDCLSFLALVAKATGKLKKGGIPNTDSAARSILHDWNCGKIKFYCKPPVKEVGKMDEDCKIVSAFSESALFDEHGELQLKEVDMRVLHGLQEQSGFVGSHDNMFIGVDAIKSSLDVVME